MIAQRRELRKLVSYRGAAASETGDARNGFAADRLGSFDVFIDQCAEYFLFSFAYTHLALNPLVCWHS